MTDHVGRSGRGTAGTGSKRASHAARTTDGIVDLYETPPEAVHALLGVEAVSMIVWEPACGPGKIVDVLRSTGRVVHASDIHDHGCPGQAVLDFFEATSADVPSGVGAIITNPPFMLIEAFIAKALVLAPTVVVLARLALLESDKRSDLLERQGLRRVHVFRKRLPMMHRHGWEGKKGNSGMAFAWFVWERGFTGKPTIHRLSWDRPKPPLPPPAPKGARKRDPHTIDWIEQLETAS